MSKSSAWAHQIAEEIIAMAARVVDDPKGRNGASGSPGFRQALADRIACALDVSYDSGWQDRAEEPAPNGLAPAETGITLQ